MIYDFSSVLYEKYSGTSWKMTDPSDYSTLEWYDTSNKPTEDELKVKLDELNNSEGIKLLRLERDRLLYESDWTQNRDVTLSNDADWKTYRQALRDLPSGANPKIDSSGRLDSSSVSWPTKPS